MRPPAASPPALSGPSAATTRPPTPTPPPPAEFSSFTGSGESRAAAQTGEDLVPVMGLAAVPRTGLRAADQVALFTAV